MKIAPIDLTSSTAEVSILHGRLLDFYTVFREFKYTVQNNLKAPFFTENTVFRIKDKDQTLILYMEESVLREPEKFTSFEAKFTSPYGYFIEAMNGRTANYTEDKTYWALLNQTAYLNKGVSTYIPSPGEHITIKLVKGRYD